MVNERVGVLWAQTDSPGVVVVVWTSVVWGKRAGKRRCRFHGDREIEEENGPHHCIPRCRKRGGEVLVVVDRP